MSQNKTTYYISSGGQNKMYTLRATRVQNYDMPGGQSTSLPLDYYVRNLSTDWETALEKAKEIAGDEFTTDPEYLDLEKIRQRDEEQMRAMREEERIAEERHARQQEEVRMEINRRIMSDEMVFGKYEGSTIKTIKENDPGYFQWLALQDESTSNFWKLNNTITYIKAAYAGEVTMLREIENRKNGNGRVYGEIKTRYKGMTLEIVNERSYEGYYGLTVWYTFLTDEGHNLQWKTSKFIQDNDGEFLEVGNKIVADFTVTEHDTDKGWTRVTRVSKPKEVIRG